MSLLTLTVIKSNSYRLLNNNRICSSFNSKEETITKLYRVDFNHQALHNSNRIIYQYRLRANSLFSIIRFLKGRVYREVKDPREVKVVKGLIPALLLTSLIIHLLMPISRQMQITDQFSSK